VRANLKAPQFLKIERYAQRLSHRVCMRDGGSGWWAPGAVVQKKFWSNNRQIYVWLDLWKLTQWKLRSFVPNWPKDSFISGLLKINPLNFSIVYSLARKNAWAVWGFLEHCFHNPYYYTVEVAIPASAHHIAWTFECSKLVAFETNLTTTRDPLSFLDVLSHCFTFTG